MFDELHKRSIEDHKRRCFYSGIVAAEIWNSSPYRGEHAKHVNAIDFVPTDEKPRRQTLDEQIAILTSVMGCGPGMVN